MWLMNNWNRLMKYFQPQIIKTTTVPDLSMRRYDNLMTGNSLNDQYNFTVSTENLWPFYEWNMGSYSLTLMRTKWNCSIV